MKLKVNLLRAAVAMSILGGTVAYMTFAPAKHMKTVLGSDHREAPTVDGLPEGDITDVYSFVDPVDSTKVDLIMNVNPFAVPAENGSYAFSPDLLYQFKIDNTGDYREDQVIQVKFDQPGQSQTASVYAGTPTTTGARNTLLATAPVASVKFNAAPATGASGITVFAGLRDDAFVFDFGQFNRILNGSQDLFRAVGSSFRGRPVRSDGTSGVDAFAGFNLTSIAVSVPKTMLRGSGPIINVWATVSQQIPTRHGQNTYTQIERQGQQAFATVFVPGGAARDAFNFAIPENDVANYSSLVPDALTTTDNDGTGNTIAGRAALLTAEGLTALPNGVPLYLPSTFANTDKNLLREALLPDVQRLNVDLPSATAANLGVGNGGLQNGRPIDFSTIDIPFQVLRQLADVHFPSGVTGGGPLGTRAALGCLQFPQCEDRRVLVVLQGTQFITPDANITQYLDGNDLPFLAAFPYLAAPHPLPGAAGTVNFPPQQ
jgi:hypothetical protein